MALILQPGQSLAVNDVRIDETRRFNVVLGCDGNLIVQGHVKSERRSRVLGDTGSLERGDVHLYFNPGGWLEIRDNERMMRLWSSHTFRPYGDDGSEVILERPAASLHLQANGLLVLYAAGGNVPSNGVWCLGGISSSELPNCVIPCTLTLDVSNGGLLVGAPSKRVINNSELVIGVTDGTRYQALLPGETVGVAAPGTLQVTGVRYNFWAPGEQIPQSADANPRAKNSPRVYGPNESDIYVVSSSGGFGLA